MIARVAVFEGSPDRFRNDSYAWIKDAVEQVSGFRGLFHLAGTEGAERSLSISLWDDVEAAAAGETAVRAKRHEVGVSPAPPTRVETFEVIEYE